MGYAPLPYPYKQYSPFIQNGQEAPPMQNGQEAPPYDHKS
jgi:hypothetical protein